MTRTWAKLPVWVWQCDSCGAESDFAPRQTALPLPNEMRERGWFIAEKWGDKCPDCALAGKEKNDG